MSVYRTIGPTLVSLFIIYHAIHLRPQQTVEVMSERSAILTTRFLGKLKYVVYQYAVRILAPVTVNKCNNFHQ